MIPVECVATYDRVLARCGDPVAILATLGTSDETLSDLAARVAQRARCSYGDVVAMFDALMDSDDLDAGTHPDAGDWDGTE